MAPGRPFTPARRRPRLHLTELASYLIGQGLVLSADVVAGHWQASVLDARHRSYLVRTAGPHGLFVKQGGARTAEAALAVEAHFYRTVLLDPRFAVLRDVVPELLLWDPGLDILVTRQFPAARDFLAVRRSHVIPAEWAGRLGRVVAACHACPLVLPAQTPSRAHRPWPLQMAAGRTGGQADAPEAALAWRQGVLADASLRSALAAVDAGWRDDTWTHGDLRWSNCLALTTPERVAVVDWEFGSCGDPDWDLGSVLQAFLLDALGSAPVLAQAPAAGLEARMREHRFAVASFWSGYCSAIGPDRRAGDPGRAIRFAGIRLLHTLFEQACATGSVPAFVSGGCDLARRLILFPELSGRQLFGLSAAGRHAVA